MTFAVTTFYKFVEIPALELPRLKQAVTERALTLEIRGLVLVSTEGCNGTVAGSPDQIRHFKEYLQSSELPFAALLFKDSEAEAQPFKRFKVDLRNEIVALKDSSCVPDAPANNHLSPQEWHEVLTSGEEVVVLDTRNFYETKLGKFRNAIDPNIARFSDLPAYLERSGIPKEKKLLMYCTGGIRCEKAVLDAQRRGFENVFQLEGGILKYLEEYPDGVYEGECFVFDNRVAVDTKLRPSTRYRLCPHCGNPGERHIVCAKCETEAVICDECSPIPHRSSCSKNCANHLKRVAEREARKRAAL